MDLWVRCRKCDPCRNYRRKVWAARAREEVRHAARTWMGTLTLRPEAHRTFRLRATVRLARRAVDFDALPLNEQFWEEVKELTPELQKYIKRIRKNTGAPLRFLMVCEAHQSGLPHFHFLLHEQDPARPVRYDDFVGQWSLGFWKAKLVQDTKSATYVCKYLAKDAAVRIRASLRYGQPDGRAVRAVPGVTCSAYDLVS